RCYRDWSSDVCSSDLEFGFQREPRAQERQHLHERPRYDRTPTEERILQHILESRQLLAVVGKEAAKVGRIGRRQQADLLFHPRRSEERRVGKERRCPW